MLEDLLNKKVGGGWIIYHLSSIISIITIVTIITIITIITTTTIIIIISYHAIFSRLCPVLPLHQEPPRRICVILKTAKQLAITATARIGWSFNM